MPTTTPTSTWNYGNFKIQLFQGRPCGSLIREWVIVIIMKYISTRSWKWLLCWTDWIQEESFPIVSRSWCSSHSGKYIPGSKVTNGVSVQASSESNLSPDIITPLLLPTPTHPPSPPPSHHRDRDQFYGREWVRLWIVEQQGQRCSQINCFDNMEKLLFCLPLPKLIRPTTTTTPKFLETTIYGKNQLAKHTLQLSK